MNPRDPLFALRPVPGGIRFAVAALALACLVSPVFAQNTPTTPPAVVDRPLAPPTVDPNEEQPSPQHMWVPGHWRWGQGSYMWVAGRWELPPVANATWVAPQWQSQGSGFVLRDGYWQQNPPPPTPTPATEVSTTQVPPPPRPEAIPEKPTPLHVWQPGYWDWSNNQFVWAAGHWEAPPKPSLIWVATHWELRDNRYVLVAGYWRENTIVVQQPAPQTVVVQQPAPAPQVVVVPPPAPRQEVMYVRPSPNHVWIGGYWAWRGSSYVWISGHWERPPHGHRAWVEPRWEHRGGNYVFIEGHWR